MKRISTRFLIIVGVFAAAFSGFLFLQTWISTRRHLEEMTAREGALALEFDLAIRKYVAEHIRPEMERRAGQEEFIPETMSTSFVARSVFDEVRRKFPDYVIKFSSDNPRNPANTAGPEELEVINFFRSHPEADRWVGRIDIDGKEYLAHFSPRRMKASCLRCHGNPEDAPALMLERYGRTAGFHRTVGDVIATDTVAIPMDHVDAALSSQASRQLAAVAVGISLLFGSILFVFRRLVSRRLAKLTRHFKRAAQQTDETPIDPVNVDGSDEIGVLAESFNAMASRIRTLHGTLERRVEERTAELARSKEKYVAVANLTGDIIVTVDGDGRWTFLNDGACEFWGRGREDLLGTHFSDYLHPDDAEATNRALQRMSQSRRPLRGLRNRQRAPSGWRMIEWNCAPIIDEAGATVGIQATGRDITDQEQAEEALRESEQQFRALYESSSDAVMLLDEKGFFDCNDATLKVFACPSKETFCSMHPGDLSPPKQPGGVDSHTLANLRIATAFEQGSNRFDWMHRRGDGNDFPAEVLLNSLEMGGRNVLQAVVRDISARKQAERDLRDYAEALASANAALEESNQAAEAANRAKSEFLAN